VKTARLSPNAQKTKLDMAKKKPAPTEPIAPATPAESQSLGEYLACIRGIKKLTLRDVEEATNKEVSNAYLSQLETGKITKPSPNVLHSLAEFYAVPYELLMEKAGYFAPTADGVLRSAGPTRHGRAATFVEENLTREEEEQLLEYLAFLRSRRGKGGKKSG
jgi:HTH-type transcriptional regulator, competence development regulator